MKKRLGTSSKTDLKILAEVGTRVTAIVGVIQAFVFLFNFNIVLFWLFLIGSVLSTVLLLVKKHGESEITFGLLFIAIMYLGVLDIISTIALMTLSHPLWIICIFIEVPILALAFYFAKDLKNFKLAICACVLAIMFFILLPNQIAIATTVT